MNRIAIALLLLLLIGCSGEPKEYIPQTRISTENYCGDAERQSLIDFVQKCIANGNNMSDEEMEDVIEQCETTGNRIVCPMTKVTYVQFEQNGSWILTNRTLSK